MSVLVSDLLQQHMFKQSCSDLGKVLHNLQELGLQDEYIIEAVRRQLQANRNMEATVDDH